MRNAALLFRNASGIFYYDRWKPIAEGVVNLALSLLFVMVFPEEYRVVGVIVATIITNLLICDTVEPFVVFKHVFGQKPGKFYVKNYTYIGLFIVALIGMTFLTTERANPISSISKIERGDWDSLSDLRLIAKVLEVPIEELVKDESD